VKLRCSTFFSLFYQVILEYQQQGVKIPGGNRDVKHSRILIHASSDAWPRKAFAARFDLLRAFLAQAKLNKAEIHENIWRAFTNRFEADSIMKDLLMDLVSRTLHPNPQTSYVPVTLELESSSSRTSSRTDGTMSIFFCISRVLNAFRCRYDTSRSRSAPTNEQGRFLHRCGRCDSFFCISRVLNVFRCRSYDESLRKCRLGP
jgi:hypothetical protein